MWRRNGPVTIIYGKNQSNGVKNKGPRHCIEIVIDLLESTDLYL